MKSGSQPRGQKKIPGSHGPVLIPALQTPLLGACAPCTPLWIRHCRRQTCRHNKNALWLGTAAVSPETNNSISLPNVDCFVSAIAGFLVVRPICIIKFDCRAIFCNAKRNVYIVIPSYSWPLTFWRSLRFLWMTWSLWPRSTIFDLFLMHVY